MPTLAQGPRLRHVYLKETTPGVTPGSGTWKILRSTTRGITTEKATLTSNESRTDGQIAVLRHGMRKISGSFGTELGLTSYDDWILASMRSAAWTAFTGATANYSATTTTFVRDTGSFITDGFRAGDIVTTAGFSNSGNNAQWRVTAVAATILTVDVSSVAPATESAGASKTIAVTSKRTDLGTTLTTFSVEKQMLDINQYQVMTGVTSNGFALKIQAEQLPTLDFNIVGMIPNAMAGTSVAGTPSAAPTNQPFVPFDGTLYDGGTKIAIVTGLDLGLVLGRSLAGVVGSYTSPTIFEGRGLITGTLTAFVQDAVLFNKFINETPSSLYLRLNDPNGVDFHNIVCNQVKYNGAPIDPPLEGGVTQALPFQAIVDPTTGASISYQKSDV